ncbi:MAG: hypothetical protein AAB403_03885 [Planctomycetota bacterium]
MKDLVVGQLEFLSHCLGLFAAARAWHISGMDTKLTPDELAALRSIDGSRLQKPLAPDIEARLHGLRLVERVSLSGTLSRTPRGDAALRVARRPSD